MFDVHQLADAFLAAANTRPLRLVKAQLHAETRGKIPHVGLPLADGFALVPTEAEWGQWFAEVEPRPPLPSAVLWLWTYAEILNFTRDEQPRVQVTMSVVRENAVMMRSQGLGPATREGLATATAQAWRMLGAPVHRRHIWGERPEG